MSIKRQYQDEIDVEKRKVRVLRSLVEALKDHWELGTLAQRACETALRETE